MAKTVKSHYRTLIGSYTLAVKCNHQRAALMTGSARNRAIWNSRSECQIPPPTGVAYEFPENKIKIWNFQKKSPEFFLWWTDSREFSIANSTKSPLVRTDFTTALNTAIMATRLLPYSIVLSITLPTWQTLPFHTILSLPPSTESWLAQFLLAIFVLVWVFQY